MSHEYIIMYYIDTNNFFFFFSLFLSPPLKAAVSQMGAAGAPTGAPKAPKGGVEGTEML